ncbi:MAG: 5-(carboxyamino)imidazole ribonucleotide synthase [Spirochaetales bacterium]|nr:5-(carboxyamino)imidazole ribonucleotide synthase [Spirochaetales bacterium]
MERLVTSNLKLGIIAGGQLAKMLIQEASKWGIITYVLDNDGHCPAAKIASHFIQGSNLDFDCVYEFGKLVDILTFEIEHVHIDALKKLKSEGYRVAPDPEILALIQDKGIQKEFYIAHGIPCAPFTPFESAEDILRGIDEGSIRYPFVQKIRKGGYDGRGVAVIHREEDVGKLLPFPSIIEEKVNVSKEISVIASRNRKGEVKCFPCVEMVFDPDANLVDKIICPSSVSREQAEKAELFASRIIELLKLEGILAVEFFITETGEVLVNEAAPRPHNSGHTTIESIITSQFEQHLRGILNLPLGSTRLKLPSVMVNILGGPEGEGPAVYEGLTESMAIDGVKIHLYGKKMTKPYRKMGHVTILSSSVEDALRKAETVQRLIKVKPWKKN